MKLYFKIQYYQVVYSSYQNVDTEEFMSLYIVANKENGQLDL